MLLLLVPTTEASYTIKNLNVTLLLNQNTSAVVTEVFQIEISNESVSQYSTNRAALDLSLSDWQVLIGPSLTQHIINPTSSSYNFKFLPGPVSNSGNSNIANIILQYDIKNVTYVNETAPRLFMYRFNPKVLNFEHGVSGEILNSNTTLTIVMPAGSVITTVYPIPDLPPYAFTTQYKNVTQVSWLYGEPLSKFTLLFTLRQSIQDEVEQFFSQIYKDLGLFSYIIIAGAIILTVFYMYRKAAS